MATAPAVPNFSQFNFEDGDKSEVVTKQNGVNAALEAFGQQLGVMTNSINEDLETISGAYYGALDADPTEDPNGNPPDVGDRYFNTVLGVEKSFNGTAWQANEVGAHLADPDPHAQYEFRVMHNTTATRAPNANDDSAAGYASRSTWFDTSLTPPEAYRCISAATGAAKWVKTSLTLDELGSAALANTGDFDPAGAATAAVSGHAAATDPHAQYEKKTALKALAYVTSLSAANIGDLEALQTALQIINVAGRGVTGDGPGLLLDGAYGLGVTDNYSPSGVSLDNGQSANGFWRADSSRQTSAHWPFTPFIGGMFQTRTSGGGIYQMMLRDNRLWFRSSTDTNSQPFNQVRSTANTTVDSNGFIKQASPIYRLSNTSQTSISEEQDFKEAGAGASNSEANGVAATHDAVGVYTVTGSLGFAVNGWTVEVPQDSNGNRLCVVETEQAQDGTITVRTFSKTVDAATGDVVANEPMDIPAGRWVDLRLNMPEPPTSDHPDEMPESPLPLTPEQEEQRRIEQLQRWREDTKVSAFQAHQALDDFGLYGQVEAEIEKPETTNKTRRAWQKATEFRRLSDTVLELAGVLGLTDEQLDELFRHALTIEA